MTPQAAMRLALALIIIVSGCESPVQRQMNALAEADSAIEAGNPERAMRVIRRALSRDPRNAQVATRLADALLRGERYGEALGVLDDLPGDVPRSPAAQSLRAWSLAELQRVDEAMGILKSLHGRGAAGTEARDRVLEAYARTRATPDAVATLPAPWRIHIAEQQTRLGHLSEAVAWLVGLPTSEKRDRLIAALLASVTREPYMAVDENLKTLAESVPTRDALLVRRRYAITQEDWAAAAALEERFLSNYVDDRQWSALALASASRYIVSGDPRAGMELIDRVVFLEPGNVDALCTRGAALRALDRDEEAVDAFELAISLDPTNERARAALARLLADNGSRSVVVDLNVRGTTRDP